jgi:hypothetical protein
MSLTLALTLNFVFVAGLLGALAWLMTRPLKLTPHVHTTTVGKLITLDPRLVSREDKPEMLVA